MSLPLGLAQVPDLTVTKELFWWVTAATAVVWLGVLAWGVQLTRRYAIAIPLVMVAGGAITYGYEPVVDVLGQCYLPESYQWTLFTTMDRSMPLYGVFVYSAFFGGFAMMSWNYLKGGGAASGLWKLYALAIFINAFLFEIPAVGIDVYTYYGNQPWELFGFPMWWPFVNTAGPIAAGALIYVLDEHVRLERRYLLAAAFVSVPLFNGFSNGGAGLPTWVALNADVSTFVVWVAGTTTILIGCLLMLATIKAIELVRAGRSETPAATPAAGSAARKPVLTRS